MVDETLPKVVELRGISQSYGTTHVIKDLDLVIRDRGDQGQFRVILGPSGCGKCVVGSTWIKTANGLKRMRDLVPHRQIGEVVEAGSSVVIRGNLESTTHAYYGGLSETLRIHTKENFLEGTPEHPILCWDNFSLIWRTLKDLAVGDWIIKDATTFEFVAADSLVKIPPMRDDRTVRQTAILTEYQYGKVGYKRLGEKHNISRQNVKRLVNGKVATRYFVEPKALNEDVAYYLGLMAGDGCITTPGYTTMDQQLADYWIWFNRHYLNIETAVSTKKGTPAVLLRPYCRYYYKRWITGIFGADQKSGTKTIPRVIELADFNCQLAYLQGLMDTDGSSHGDGRVEIAMNSKDNIDFVCNMFSALNIGYTRFLIKGKSHRVAARYADNTTKLFRLKRKIVGLRPVDKRYSWADLIPGSKEVLATAGIKVKRDVQRVAYQRYSKTIGLPELPPGRCCQITHIENGQDEVFDLSNPTSHSYVANGIISHNSTILRFIAGLQQPTTGQVLLKDKPRTDQDRVGMVFQKYSSLPWLTVQENAELGLKLQGVPEKERKERAKEMLVLVGLEGHETKFAQYPSLSGGQLQRVAIARSLLVSPQILLMDEPFGALDIKTRLQMQNLLLSVWNNLHTHGTDCTIVFVTHDISEAVYLADIVYIMGGRPSKIVDRVEVDFPPNRGQDIKKSPNFISLVQQIEAKMMA